MAVETTSIGGRRGPEADARYHYCVYGIGVASDAPLGLPQYADGGLGHVACSIASASSFAVARQSAAFTSSSDSWYRYAPLPDGSTYVQWDTVGEFLVDADGRRITCRRAEESSDESFQVYLLGQALSFALVKQGFEPLHATVIVVEGEAVALLGHNAFGKSSLAACFLESGHRLLTDDLLLVHESPHGVVAYPGPPRIKLFSRIANRFLGHIASGARMNAGTDKLILPLAERQRCAGPVRLKAIYSLAAPRDACRTPIVSIETLSPREAFVELVKGTFNRRLVSPQRLARQFDLMTSLAAGIGVKRLTYPRAIDRLHEVQALVLADLARGAHVVQSDPMVNPPAFNRG